MLAKTQFLFGEHLKHKGFLPASIKGQFTFCPFHPIYSGFIRCLTTLSSVIHVTPTKTRAITTDVLGSWMMVVDYCLFPQSISKSLKNTADLLCFPEALNTN